MFKAIRQNLNVFNDNYKVAALLIQNEKEMHKLGKLFLT